MASERLKMDFVVIEVGMSGRLDATDATKPLLYPLCQRRRRPPRFPQKRGDGDLERGGDLEEREAVRVEKAAGNSILRGRYSKLLGPSFRVR